MIAKAAKEAPMWGETFASNIPYSAAEAISISKITILFLLVASRTASMVVDASQPMKSISPTAP